MIAVPKAMMCPDDVLTEQYRQDVIATAAGAPKDSLARKVAHQFVDKLVDSNDEDAKKSVEWVDYACSECGSILHPGFQKTLIQAKRLSNKPPPSVRRTLRRRRQRKRKQAALNQKAEPKRGHQQQQNRKDASSSPNDTSPSRRLVVLREDPSTNFCLERHHLVIRCGNCENKVRIKGLKRKQSAKKHEASIEDTKQASAKPNPRAENNTGTSEDGFVPLSSPGSNGLQPRKKRKKKKGGLGSKLLDYLSSLND